ncbi:MAG: maleylpyruvate isomerase family mycothiol-dependent enzyme [Ilumatobacteraceae bacterium]
MTGPLPLPYDPIAHLRTDGVKFLEIVADHGFDHTVPSCPEWTLGDLTWHLGGIWNRFARVVAERIATRDAWAELPRPQRPGDELLLDWVTAAHTSLVSALTRAEPDQEVGTWAGTKNARWVERRMTQETALHRWDAAHAVGLPYELPVAVAADGIDEFLVRWFSGAPHEGVEPVGGSVHLHCTDIDEHHAEGSDDRTKAGGEWLVSSVDASGATLTREHAKGDAAVRGRAHDLLLWLWRRDGDPVEIIGDTEVAERFRAFADL